VTLSKRSEGNESETHIREKNIQKKKKLIYPNIGYSGQAWETSRRPE
jgi:hypothetical protein